MIESKQGLNSLEMSMILSDKDIHPMLRSGELVILGTDTTHPFDAAQQVQPCSIDLRLGNRFLRFKATVDRFDVSDMTGISSLMEEYIVADKEPIELLPNSIVFGQIYEQLRLPPLYCGYIEGRSRFARLGLSVHVTGGFINPEFEGAMPLQIVNNNRFPIVIYPYMTICQLILGRLSSPPLIPYPRRSNNPYHKESKAGPSVIGEDPALAFNSQFLPSLNHEIELRLLTNYLNQLNAMDEKKRMIDAFNESSLGKRGSTTINVSQSTIGVLNSGTSSNIDASVQVILQHGGQEIAEAISELSKAIGSSTLEQKDAEEALEVLSVIATEAEKPPAERPHGAIKALLSRFESLVRVSEGLHKIWEQWGPVLQALIGG
jgi:dCTP deaminase